MHAVRQWLDLMFLVLPNDSSLSCPYDVRYHKQLVVRLQTTIFQEPAVNEGLASAPRIIIELWV